MRKNILHGVAVAVAMAVAAPSLAAAPATGTVPSRVATVAVPAAPLSTGAGAERTAGTVDIAARGYHKRRYIGGRGYYRGRGYLPRRHFRKRVYGPPRHRYRTWHRPYRRRAICTRRVVRFTPRGKVVRVVRGPCGFVGRRW